MQFIWTRFADFTLDDLYDTLAFRQAVLVVEQGSAYADLDSLDRSALHLRVMTDTGLAGYARCHGPADGIPYASFGRLVVAPDHRRNGLGRRMVEAVLGRLAGQQCDVVISAQLYLQNFYSGFGFVAASEPYDDAGIGHVRMRLARATRDRRA